jgi:hypothetical protein
VNALEITKRPYRRQFWSWPQKGFGEIASTVPFAPDPFSKDVLEADFGGSILNNRRLGIEYGTVLAFLRKAHTQSGFSVRR